LTQADELGAAYAFDGPALELGALVLDGVANPEARKATVGTFPKSNVYADLGELLTTLGIGEAVVTILSENGAPTPVAWTRLRPPSSLMAQLAPAQQQAMVAASPLQAEDGTTVDRDSAYEMLLTKVAPAPEEAPEPAPRRRGRSPSGRTWPLRAVRSPPSSDPACSRASPVGRLRRRTRNHPRPVRHGTTASCDAPPPVAWPGYLRLLRTNA
jgi:hypothetical protein